MPRILEMKEENGELWVRVSPLKSGESVRLWTEYERKAAREAERERCMNAIQQLGRQSDDDEAD